MRPSRLTHDQQIAADTAAIAQREREATARPIKPQPTCSTCQRFIPDPLNPTAGMGFCSYGHGYHYPGAPHRCADHMESA